MLIMLRAFTNPCRLNTAEYMLHNSPVVNWMTLNVFRAEHDIVCVIQVNQLESSDGVDTGVLKTLMCPPHPFTDG